MTFAGRRITTYYVIFPPKLFRPASIRQVYSADTTIRLFIPQRLLCRSTCKTHYPLRGELIEKLKLHGFNNLTKSLSFCIYDICYAKTAEERDGYIAYIDELYNANRLTEILSETCSIIGANILNIARQDYEPRAPA